jgi:hypothetical protein
LGESSIVKRHSEPHVTARRNGIFPPVGESFAVLDAERVLAGAGQVGTTTAGGNVLMPQGSSGRDLAAMHVPGLVDGAWRSRSYQAIASHSQRNADRPE